MCPIGLSSWVYHVSFVFYNVTSTTEIYTYLHSLSLLDALPIFHLETKATPRATFRTFSGGIGWDSETTNELGYTYYGSDTDWTGFDDGTRDVPPLLKAAFASGKPILEGADFSLADLKAIQMELVNSEKIGSASCRERVCQSV